MSLSKMTKEEIELLSYTDIAKIYLEENKKVEENEGEIVQFGEEEIPF